MRTVTVTLTIQVKDDSYPVNEWIENAIQDNLERGESVTLDSYKDEQNENVE